MKLEKSLNGIVPALCYKISLIFVTYPEKHKVSVHISDLFNSLNFRLFMNIKNYIKSFIFFNKHFLNSKQKQEIISSLLVNLNTLDF